jgi:hypothetical protein
MTMPTPENVIAWQYIANEDDAPESCKDIAKELLRQYNIAVNIHDQHAKRVGELGTLVADARRNIMPTLKQQIATSKKHSLVDLVAERCKAEKQLVIANEEKKVAEQLLNSMRHKLSAELRANRSTLLAWIATRRAVNISAHGYTDLITPELEYIYKSLNIVWHPKWNEGLTLPHNSRLPLVFQAGWIKDAHESAAWAWQHIALGEVREKNHHHFVTAYVDSLPRIEQPSTPMRTLTRFGNS